MANNKKTILTTGIILLNFFVIWTMIIQTVDVQNVGQNGTSIGLATINSRFHELTGVHMSIYTITDWLGLVPIAICMIFGMVGLIQLIRRRSLLKVDLDIIFLGVYYILVIFGYLIFEMIPINYRPVLINGFMEASYPSSTTLLVLSVMPTLNFQTKRRLKNKTAVNIICLASIAFMLFMVIGRTVAGVHWLTDIIGSVTLSFGLFLVYRAVVMIADSKKDDRSA
ncbi:MAG: phosphatase PAP2 family protein [Clostridiales bacterium]|nr:phosphatase PAP2 family protein [Clostridiales bacterium]